MTGENAKKAAGDTLAPVASSSSSSSNSSSSSSSSSISNGNVKGGSKSGKGALRKILWTHRQPN